MRKGSGSSGAAGLFNPVTLHPHFAHQHPPHALLHNHQPPGGAPIIPPHLTLPGHSAQQFQGLQHSSYPQSHQQLPPHQGGSSMVQQRATPGGGNPIGGGGRVFLNSHHSSQGHYMHQAGLILQSQQQQHHNPPPHHPPSAGPLQHVLPSIPGQRPLIPQGGAGFGNHPSGMGQGYMGSQSAPHANYGQNAGINSHFGTVNRQGESRDIGGLSSGGGDLPPIETVVARLETACRLLHGIGSNNTRLDAIGPEIQILSEDLRRVGAMLENTYPEVLDRVMSSMRDASAQPCLPPSLRLAIFELVELRASKWILPSDSSNYYRQRRNLNDAAASSEGILEERSGRSSASSGGVQSSNNSQVTVVVTTPAGGNGNTVGLPGNVNNNNNQSVDLDTPPPPQAAKTFREEIVIKNSDSGKVAPTAKERVLSINGYSQQSINLAKQLIQETITRNASPVLDGMVLPGSSSPAGAAGEVLEMGDDAEMTLKRMQLSSAGGGGATASVKLSDGSHHAQHGASHFSYTVSLGEKSIKILGDDLQFVQEAKMTLDDYFLQKYPDLFCANGIEEDEDDEDEDFQEACLQRYDRETLLNLSMVRTPPPDFSHLEPDIRGNIVLEKPRQFDVDKFAREMGSLTLAPSGGGSSTVPSTPTSSVAPVTTVSVGTTTSNTNKTSDILPG